MRAFLLALPLLAACAWDNPFLDGEDTGADCAERLAFYPDQDGDGAGDGARVYVGCEAPEGWVAQAGDCDDADPAVIACPDTGPAETGA